METKASRIFMIRFSPLKVCFLQLEARDRDRVQTSIALPVGMDRVNELIDNINRNNAPPNDLQFPKPN